MGNRYNRLASVCAITALMLLLLNTSCSKSGQPANPVPTQTPLPAQTATPQQTQAPLPAQTAIPQQIQLPIPTPELVSGTPGSVFINPKSQTAGQAGQIKVGIEVIPAGWGVSAAEVQVSFDPTKLEALSIQPGEALGPKTISGAQKIDNDRGTIVYALARQGETTAPGVRGVLANLEFRGKSGATGNAKIEITGVGLSNENFEKIIGVKYEGAIVAFQGR